MTLPRDERGWRIPGEGVSKVIYEGMVEGLDDFTILERAIAAFPERRTTINTIRVLAHRLRGARKIIRRDERGWTVPLEKLSISRVVYEGLIAQKTYEEIVADCKLRLPDQHVTKHCVWGASARLRNGKRYDFGKPPKPPKPIRVKPVKDNEDDLIPPKKTTRFSQMAEASLEWELRNAIERRCAERIPGNTRMSPGAVELET